jgi:methylated-DNA-[protein]-cysteine S-methyltransferase
MQIYTTFYTSPLGLLKLAATTDFVCGLSFVEEKMANEAEKETENVSFLPPFLQICTQQLDEYFAHIRKEFTLPLFPQGTDFQQTVWQELQKIPFGTTISYMMLAKRLGNEKVIRAAGTANGKNPIAIIIPCHRVIGADGSLTGYAGGLHRKKWLLEHEGVLKEQKTLW